MAVLSLTLASWSGTVSTTADTPYELSFDVSPRPGFESYMDFEVSAIDVSTGTVLKTVAIDWDGNTVSEMTWEQHSIEFVGTGGDVRLVFTDVGVVHSSGRGAFVDDIRFSQSSGFAGGAAIAMSALIAVSLTDTDGSENLGNIEIANIPTGAVLEVSGVAVSVVDGVATVTPAQLPNLTFTAPDGFTGDLDLEVTATSTETSNGNTASTTDTLTMTIVSNDENFDSSGSSSSTTVNGDSSDNILYGGAGNDTLNGGDGNDVLYGGSGNDTLNGDAGNDTLLGGDGNDTLNGGTGDDFLLGADGNDTLDGGAGDDALYGGAGDDSLTGGAGDDVLTGGLGADTAIGGDGDDIYIFGNGDGSDSFAGGGGTWTDAIELSGHDGAAAYSDWTLAGATVVETGSDYLVLSEDSAGTITMDDGSEITFTGVDRIEW